MWTLAVLSVLIASVAILVAAVDSGHCREWVIRFFALRIGRPIEVEGALEAHIWSLNPQVIAERVTIGNPPWMPSGRTAEIGKLSIVIKLHGFGHASGIVGLNMEATKLYLQRDPQGRANWQLTDPSKGGGEENVPIVRSLSMPNAHVVLEDALRHLSFQGTVSAMDVNAAGTVQPLRIDGAGQLNGKPVSFEISADSLVAASHQSPYHFTFAEHSSGSKLEGRGLLPRPFDFNLLDATFEAAGLDLKDLYFLTGVTLIDTGSFHLSGKVSRRGAITTFSDLAASTGQSDLRGGLSINSSSGRPRLDADLSSETLRSRDLGARAAGRSSEPESPLLLSDAKLSINVLRRGEAAVNFRAHRVDVGRLAVHEVSAKARIDHGVFTVSPLSAEVLGGTATGHLKLDARKEVPAADVDLKITDLQLAQVGRKASQDPSIAGLLQARVTITGAGSSVHQVAASANGTVRVQVPHGEIRESFAELTGIDWRGLGLLLSHNKVQIPLRCAIADFKADAGTLTAQSLIADTEPVLISGEGRIHLDSEALDLTIRGHPKSLRLFRLRAPVLLRGTLGHPSIAIQESKSALVIVDPGRAKDANCAALLAEENSGP
ncbi:MAG TPA: AsmA family protein [Steroidobacteraceae bacterium]|jgi:uncharacterized protein involved in outer membrane biogenesis